MLPNKEQLDQCHQCDGAVHVIETAYRTASPALRETRVQESREQIKTRLNCPKCPRLPIDGPVQKP